MIKVQQLMTRDVHTCRPEDSLEAAASLLWEHDVGSAPVVSDQGRLVGMITDRDICMHAFFRNHPLSDLRVADAMARRVHSVRADDWVSRAEALMRDAQVRRLPVVDGAEIVVGIITQNDLLREAVGEWRTGRRDITSDDVVSTLNAIGRPHSRAAAS